jgi:DNA (cytosine-5)-methyltransferase 1
VQRYVLDAAEPFIVPVKTWGGGGNEPRSIHRPMRTVTASKRGEHAIVVPTLVQTGYGERDGQAPRSLDLGAPLGTVVAGGVKHALVAAFLAQHNTGMVGHDAREPVSTIVGKVGPQAVVASHLLKLRGGLDQHPNTAQDLRRPVPTITAAGNHVAEVRAFLLKYYGADQDPRLDEPLHTVTTRDRFALVTVAGVDYVIADIGMRMLTPRELFRAQGFPDSYRINPADEVVARQLRLWCDQVRVPLSKSAQVKCCGNSVCPPVAAALARAQFASAAASEAA